MQQITLSDLLACDDAGTMLVAQDRVTSAPVHIASAIRGGQCDCVCAACERPLVARKGTVRQHSFAHYPKDVQRSCMAAGESALHKFAKAILSEKRYIVLPPMIAKDEGEELALKPASRIEFDRVELERSQGDVIPDVVCYKGGYRLFVEFKVTHAVDDEKRQRLRDHDAAVLEIDLSAYRDMNIDDLEIPILEDAPRVILQSTLINRGVARLREERARRLQALRAKAGELAVVYKEDFSTFSVSSENWYIEALKHGVDTLFGDHEPQSRSFLVQDRDWKLWIMWRFLSSVGGQTVRHLAFQMMQFDWMKPLLFSPEPALCDLARSEFLSTFRSATEEVHRFLDEQKANGLLYRRSGNRYFPNGGLLNWFDDRKRQLDAPFRRKREVNDQVDELLKLVGVEERRSFDFEQWLGEYAVGKGVPGWLGICGQDGAEYARLWEELHAIKREMGWKQPNPQIDLLGLPVAKVIAEKWKNWLDQQAERDRQRAERLLVEAEGRATRLEAAAVGMRSSSLLIWLSLPIAYDGLTDTPEGHARRSVAGSVEMYRLLQLEQRKLADLAKFEERKTEAQAMLLQQATAAFGSAEKAALWLRSQLRELEMQRPSEYCIDGKTLEICLALLPNPRRR